MCAGRREKQPVWAKKRISTPISLPTPSKRGSSLRTASPPGTARYRSRPDAHAPYAPPGQPHGSATPPLPLLPTPANSPCAARGWRDEASWSHPSSPPPAGSLTLPPQAVRSPGKAPEYKSPGWIGLWFWCPVSCSPVSPSVHPRDIFSSPLLPFRRLAGEGIAPAVGLTNFWRVGPGSARDRRVRCTGWLAPLISCQSHGC
jgi:hypothetical protein